MKNMKTKNQKRKEFQQLGSETTMELLSMGMTETEIHNFWNQCVARVTLTRQFDKYDRRVSRMLWFSIGFLAAALILYVLISDNLKPLYL